MPIFALLTAQWSSIILSVQSTYNNYTLLSWSWFKCLFDEWYTYLLRMLKYKFNRGWYLSQLHSTVHAMFNVYVSTYDYRNVTAIDDNYTYGLNTTKNTIFPTEIIL